MTDPITTEAPAAAAPEPTATDPVDYSAHPVWADALAPIPEVLRGPLVETIRSTEAETQKAIEKARTETVPSDWRELAAEAQEMGLTPEQLAAAYRGQNDLAELLQTDPDKFLSEMQAQVDALVQSGQITRRQGADAVRQAAAVAAEAGDDLLTDDQKTIRELQEWRKQQEARDAQRQQQEQAQREQQEQEQRLEAAAEQFFDEFDRQMIAGGYAKQEGGRVVSVIPPETLQYIGEFAGNLIDRNPRLSHADAVRQATAQVKQQIEATGGKLGPAAAPAAPVIGGSTTMPAPGAAAAQAGTPRNMEDRSAAALAEVLRMTGS